MDRGIGWHAGLALNLQLAPEFAKIGLKLEGMAVQNLSLPEELQKFLNQKIGMGMVGNDMGLGYVDAMHQSLQR